MRGTDTKLIENYRGVDIWRFAHDGQCMGPFNFRIQGWYPYAAESLPEAREIVDGVAALVGIDP